MSGNNDCNICRRNVLRHSYHRRCKLCKHLIHIKCLPNVSKTDNIYTYRDSDNWYCTLCTSEVFPYNNILDDEEFMLTLSELWELPETLPYELDM